MRFSLLFLYLFLTGSLISVYSCTSSQEDNASYWYMAVGTYTKKEAHVNGKGQGVYILRIDPETGMPHKHKVLNNLINPSYVVAHPVLPKIYGVNEHDQDGSGTVFGATIHLPAYRPEIDNFRRSEGTFPCQISTDKSGKLLFVANYGSGSISVFQVSEEGLLEGDPYIAMFEGNPDMGSSHAHMARTDPENRFLYVTDLGLDSIHIFKITPDSPPLVQVGGAKSGHSNAGPRHLDFHPTLPYVYVVNEFRASIDVFRRDSDTGNLEYITEVGLIRAGIEGPASGAHIQVHPNGKFLYASNRGDFNEVIALRIDESTGIPAVIDIYPTGGKTPRNFTISPDGRFLYAGNQDTNTIRCYKIDQESGRLEKQGTDLDILTPVCLQFLPAWEDNVDATPE